MAPVPLEAGLFIKRYQLGTPTAVYKPYTIGRIIGGLFFMAFAVGWTWFAASLTGSPLLPADLSLFHFPVQFPDTIQTILGIVFPLFGVIFIIMGLWVIVKAILNRHVRAVVCVNGIVSVERSGADAFRWEQVATIFHKITEQVHTTRYQSGGTSTTRTTSHSYTINCHDGRRFVFDSTLGRVKRLGETIEYEVARLKRR